MVTIEAKRILIKTDSQTKALGAWVYSSSREKLIVYFSPICLYGGWFGKALGELAKQLKATVVAIDLPGTGQSQGGTRAGDGIGLRNKFHSYYNFDLKSLSKQLQKAACWLKQEFDSEKVYTMGTSIGGVIQSYMLAEDNGKCLDGAIFQAGFASSGKEIQLYVWQPILRLPQWSGYKKIKNKINPPIPVFLFTRWSQTPLKSVFVEFLPTIRLLYRVIQDPETAICFSLSTLESLIYAPKISLPADIPILFLRSEKDRSIINQRIEVFLERHPCSKTIVTLKGAPHLIFESQKYTQLAIKVIQQWLDRLRAKGLTETK